MKYWVWYYYLSIKHKAICCNLMIHLSILFACYHGYVDLMKSAVSSENVHSIYEEVNCKTAYVHFGVFEKTTHFRYIWPRTMENEYTFCILVKDNAILLNCIKSNEISHASVIFYFIYYIFKNWTEAVLQQNVDKFTQ